MTTQTGGMFQYFGFLPLSVYPCISITKKSRQIRPKDRIVSTESHRESAKECEHLRALKALLDEEITSSCSLKNPSKSWKHSELENSEKERGRTLEFTEEVLAIRSLFVEALIEVLAFVLDFVLFLPAPILSFHVTDFLILF